MDPFTENNDENEYLELESGYMTLGFSLKTMKSKSSPKYIEFLQGLLGCSSNKKSIEDNKLMVETNEKHYEFEISKDTTIGSFLYFSKAEGLIGQGDQSYLFDIRKNQKLLELEKRENDQIILKKEENNGNKASFRLESITDWLKENQSRSKKKRKQENNDINEKEQIATNVIAKKSIKKKKKNINALLKKLKS